MDDQNWCLERFSQVKKKLGPFFLYSGYSEEDALYVPVSGLSGANITNSVNRDERPLWLQRSVLEAICGIKAPLRNSEVSFRMPILQWFDNVFGEDEEGMENPEGLGTTLFGRIECGRVRVGDVLDIMPSEVYVSVDELTCVANCEMAEVEEAGPTDYVLVLICGIEHTGILNANSVFSCPGYPIHADTHYNAYLELPERSNFVITACFVCKLMSIQSRVRCTILEIEEDLIPRHTWRYQGQNVDHREILQMMANEDNQRSQRVWCRLELDEPICLEDLFSYNKMHLLTQPKLRHLV